MIQVINGKFKIENQAGQLFQGSTISVHPVLKYTLLNWRITCKKEIHKSMAAALQSFIDAQKTLKSQFDSISLKGVTVKFASFTCSNMDIIKCIMQITSPMWHYINPHCELQ